jgi:hypothetical protein
MLAAVCMTVVTILLGGCVAASPNQSTSSDEPPTAKEVQAAVAHLPSDPALAAMRLVDELGKDRRTALAASAALLVRSGFGLIDEKPALVVTPKTVMAADELVPLQTIPWVTDSVLSGADGDASGFAKFLASVGVTSEPFSSTSVAALVNGWGETASATPQDRFAGAALRALAARRGNLAIAGTQARLDALQEVILFGRLTATYVDVPKGVVPRAGSIELRGGVHPAGMVRASLVSDCKAELSKASSIVRQLLEHAGVKGAEQIQEVLEEVATKRLEEAAQFGELKATIYEEAIADATQQGFRDEAALLTADAAKVTAKNLRFARALKVLGALGGAISTADTVVTIWQTALETMLLVHGIRLSLDDDAPGHKTHFRHKGDGAHSAKTNVTFTATLTFDRGKVSKEMLSCYHAMGIDIPDGTRVSGEDSKGRSNGWYIVWSIGENLAPNNWYGSVPHGDVLRPAAPDWGDGRQPVSADGTAKMVTRTRTERDAPQNKGTEHEVAVDVYAKVDYAKPVDLTQVTENSDIIVMLAGDLIRSVSFPQKQDRVVVGYHGPDVYLARGHASINTLFAPATMALDADTYSCDGLAGPWKGTVGEGGELTATGEFLQQITGASGPATGSASGPVSFSLDPAKTTPQLVDGAVGLRLQYLLQNLPKRGEHIDGYVGQATWIFPGSDVAANELIRGAGLLPLSSGLTMDVRGVPHDDRCPGPAFDENGWD